MVLRHPVWHDTCGGCHASPAPSGLVALSREYTMGQPLKCSFQNDLQKCPVENTAHHRQGHPSDRGDGASARVAVIASPLFSLNLYPPHPPCTGEVLAHKRYSRVGPPV